MIERQGVRLLRLVEDVLTAARIEAGMTRLRREQVDLKAVAATVIEYLSQTERAAGHEIKFHAEPDYPRVWGNKGAVGQMLYNLIENALKYSDAGSTVILSVGETPTEAVIEVSDRGPGMSSEQLDTIFDRFKRADSSSKRSVGGFGLGLYIVKNLVDAHNGEIAVTSEVGVGSRFTLRLPKRGSEVT
jgi:signal transduction histidine kinase